MSAVIKLSAPAKREFWEIPVLFEDAHLLAIDKPSDLLVSPDRLQPERSSLVQLLHDAIAAGKPWAVARGTTYLSPAHRLDAEASGVLLLAKSKAMLIQLANRFSSGQVQQQFLTLVQGNPAEAQFQINARLGRQSDQAPTLKVDPRNGKRMETRVTVLERFAQHALVRCEPVANRPHQIRAHLCNSGLRVVGDERYGGKPLWLSRLKKDFRLKPGREERPLLAQPALHAEQLTLSHPATNAPINLTAPWPKHLRVAVKYLREFAPPR